jgi:hypothetical protein
MWPAPVSTAQPLPDRSHLTTVRCRVLATGTEAEQTMAHTVELISHELLDGDDIAGAVG